MTKRDDRTKQLITGVLSDRQFINNIYDSAQGSLRTYLMHFFNANNDDGVMSINDLRKNVTSDDYKLFQQVLDKYEGDLIEDDEGVLRLKKAKKVAGLDKQNLLGAVFSILIATASLQVNNYLGQSLTNEYQYAMNFQSGESIDTGHKTNIKYSAQDIDNQANKLLKSKNFGLTVQQRVWIKNDKLSDRINNAVNKGLNTGIDNNYMSDHLFKNFGNSPNSITTAINKTEGFYKNELINQEKTRFGKSAASDVFDRYNVNRLYWNLASTHPRTDICDDLANNGPYTRTDYPNQPHWGCICYPSSANEN